MDARLGELEVAVMALPSSEGARIAEGLIESLGEDDRRRVPDYARSLSGSPPRGVTGESLPPFFGCIPSADLDEMAAPNADLLVNLRPASDDLIVGDLHARRERFDPYSWGSRALDAG